MSVTRSELSSRPVGDRPAECRAPDEPSLLGRFPTRPVPAPDQQERDRERNRIDGEDADDPVSDAPPRDTSADQSSRSATNTGASSKQAFRTAPTTERDQATKMLTPARPVGPRTNAHRLPVASRSSRGTRIPTTTPARTPTAAVEAVGVALVWSHPRSVAPAAAPPGSPVDADGISGRWSTPVSAVDEPREPSNSTTAVATRPSSTSSRGAPQCGQTLAAVATGSPHDRHPESSGVTAANWAVLAWKLRPGTGAELSTGLRVPARS